MKCSDITNPIKKMSNLEGKAALRTHLNNEVISWKGKAFAKYLVPSYSNIKPSQIIRALGKKPLPILISNPGVDSAEWWRDNRHSLQPISRKGMIS